jgi:hypothetical protein
MTAVSRREQGSALENDPRMRERESGCVREGAVQGERGLGPDCRLTLMSQFGCGLTSTAWKVVREAFTVTRLALTREGAQRQPPTHSTAAVPMRS